MTVLVVIGVGVVGWVFLEWYPALARRRWRGTLARGGRQRLNGRGVAFAGALGVGMFALAATTPPGMLWWRPVGVIAGVTLLALAASSAVRGRGDGAR